MITLARVGVRTSRIGLRSSREIGLRSSREPNPLHWLQLLRAPYGSPVALSCNELDGGFFRKREIKKESSLPSQWVVVVNSFLICLFENEGAEEPCLRWRAYMQWALDTNLCCTTNRLAIPTPPRLQKPRRPILFMSNFNYV